MSSLDELQQGLNIFHDSVQRFVTTNALSNASQQLDQINQQVFKNENEKLQARQAVSDSLAINLAGAGVPATTIQETAGRFGIGADRQSMVQEAQRSQESSQQFTASENAKNRQLERDLSKQKLEMMVSSTGGKLSNITANRLEKARKNFQQQSKVPLESYNKADIALKMLSAGNPVADTAIGNFLVRASGDVGNITEAEREVYFGSRSLPRWATRIIQRGANGKLTDADRADIMKFASIMRNVANDRLNKTADQEIGSVKTIIKVSGDNIKDNILRDAIFPQSDLAYNSASSQSATSPNSPAQPNMDVFKFLRDK